MYYETINKDRLMQHKQLVNKLNNKRERKRELEARMGLKSIDFSKDKVINGNSKHISEQERFVQRLEKLNKEIRKLEAVVLPEQQEIETQLSRIEKIDWRYKEILQSYYIDDISAKEIIMEIFGVDSHKNPTIWKQYYRLQKSAIKELQKVSTKPFIELEQQLVLEV